MRPRLSRGLGLWLALAACVPPTEVAPTPEGNPGVTLLRDLDSGEAAEALTEGMAGVFGQGLAQYGRDLRRDLGPFASAEIVEDNGAHPGAWRTVVLSGHYGRSAFPVRISSTFDERGRLAGFFVATGGGDLTEAEITAALSSLPGQWSVSAEAAAHPEVRYAFRGDVAQPVASQYKVLLLARACAAISRGEWTLAQRLTLPAEVRGVPSCILCAFDGGLQPTVRDVLHLLVSASDNTAADLLRDQFGRRELESFAERQGIAHPPPLISTQGLFALECGAGELASRPPASWGAFLASLSPDERVAAADEAARDAFREGPEGMKRRCWDGHVPGEASTAVAEAVDWPFRTDELVRFYASAQRGELDSPATARCFLDFMEEGGAGPVGLDAHFLRGGDKNGLESDIRSLGLVYETDRGPIALSLSVHAFPTNDTDHIAAELDAAARATAHLLYRRLSERPATAASSASITAASPRASVASEP